MTIDPGALYRSCRERITTMVTASGVNPDLVVPATPHWTVHDVVAHLAGISEDATSGNMEGAPGDAWTAAQIERGAGRSIDDLVAQWTANAPMLESFFSSPAGSNSLAGVFDVHCHEADLRHALGLPIDIPADFLAWAAASMRTGFGDAVLQAGLEAVQLEIGDLEWFRGRLGRRTGDEVRAYPWPRDPEPYLDTFFVFGPAARALGEAA
jgi:uncharacterized protein (TIGR03083 family)